MTISEWHEAGQQLASAGLHDLAAVYFENAKRKSRGEAVIWPIPADRLASARLAGKPAPEPFADDGRED